MRMNSYIYVRLVTLSDIDSPSTSEFGAKTLRSLRLNFKSLA